MRMQSRSHGGSGRRSSAAARRHFRPRGESLEARLAPAVGVFNDDFSNDADSSKAGFDTAADGLEIVNDLPRYGVTEGSTGRQGYYYLQEGNPGDPGWGLHAHGHILAIVSSAFFTPQVTFDVPTPGTPGSHDADEEVSGIGVSVQGFGRVVIIGAIGSVTVQLPGNTTWQRIAAFRDDLLPGGARLGAIQALHIYSSEFVAIDNVTVEVSSAVQYTPPVANDDVIVVDRRFGASEIFNPIDNDFDAQGNPLFLVSNTQPARGTVQEFYDPFGNFRGFTYHASADALADLTFREDSFTYTIRNTPSTHGSATDTATVRLVLNAPPIAIIDDYELPHGFSGAFDVDLFGGRGVLDNDVDHDSDSLAVTGHGQPKYGTVTFTPDGRFQYTPTTPGGLVLPDAFTYAISDGYFTAHGHVLIHVPNAAPIARNDFIVTPHGDTEIEVLNVIANDPGDPEGDPLLPPRIVTQPEHGSLSLNPDGTLRYVAASSQIANDSFTYRLADPYAEATGEGNLATVRILVPNRLPYAASDEYHFAPGGIWEVSAPGGVLANDTDADGDPLRVVTVTKQPTHGTLTLRPDGSFTYEMAASYYGVDTFGYLATDEIGNSREAVVQLIISDGIPHGRHDTYVIPKDYGRWYGLDDLLDNDWDPQGLDLSLDNLLPGDPPFGGAISVEPGAPLAYFPTPGFEGFDAFSYTVTNGTAESAPIPVDILVTDDDTYIPHGQFDFYHVQHDQPLQVIRSNGLLKNDYLAPTPSDPTPTITLQVVSPPKFGTLSAASPLDTGAFTYTPNPGFVGHDLFTYRIYNQFFYSRPIQVAIDVLDEAPVARDDFYTVREGSFVWANVLANDADPDDTDLRAELLLAPTSGTTILQPNGDLYFEPPAGSLGLYRLTYVVFDGARFSHTAEVSIGAYNDNTVYLAAPNHQTVIAQSPPGTTLEASVTGTPPATPPTGVDFPLGYYHFVIHNVPVGGEATVRLTLPADAPPINSYWKFGSNAVSPDDHWYRFNHLGNTGAEFLPDEILLHFVDGGRGDDDLTANGVIVDPGGPAFSALPPSVVSVVLNDGGIQRSKINTLTVTFSEIVSIEPGAFDVRKIGARHPVKLHVELSQSAGRTVAKLTFKGAGIIGGSLADGQYRLSIDADKIRDAAGRLLDGDGDGQEGGNYVDEFFRRFGDTDGDGDVDKADKTIFKSAFGKRSSQPGYLWYLDFNANGRIWAEDAALFLLGYCRSNQRR